MGETLLAALLDGLIYVLAKEARTRDIDLNHEAQRANFDKDLIEYVNQVTKEIEDEEKSVIKVPSLQCEDKPCIARVTEDIEEDIKIVIDVLPPSKKMKCTKL